MQFWLLPVFCFLIATPLLAQPADSSQADPLYAQYRKAVPLPAAQLPAAQRPAALQAISRFLQQHPNYTLGYTEQIQLALQTERSALVQQSLAQLERLKAPAALPVYQAGIQLAIDQSQYPLALKLLQQAQRQHGSSAPLLLQQAAVYKALNNATEAIKSLQQARALAPKSPAVLYALAQTYQSNNPRQSAELYQQLLSYEAYRPVALAALGSLYWQLYQADPGPNNRPNLERAAQYYRQYALLRPNDETVRALLQHLNLLLQEEK